MTVRWNAHVRRPHLRGSRLTSGLRSTLEVQNSSARSAPCLSPSLPSASGRDPREVAHLIGLWQPSTPVPSRSPLRLTRSVPLPIFCAEGAGLCGCCCLLLAMCRLVPLLAISAVSQWRVAACLSSFGRRAHPAGHTSGDDDGGSIHDVAGNASVLDRYCAHGLAAQQRGTVGMSVVGSVVSVDLGFGSATGLSHMYPTRDLCAAAHTQRGSATAADDAICVAATL